MKRETRLDVERTCLLTALALFINHDLGGWPSILLLAIVTIIWLAHVAELATWLVERRRRA